MFDGGHGLVGVFVFDDDGVFDVGWLVADPWLGDDEVGLVVVFGVHEVVGVRSGVPGR